MTLFLGGFSAESAVRGCTATSLDLRPQSIRVAVAEADGSLAFTAPINALSEGRTVLAQILERESCTVSALVATAF